MKLGDVLSKTYHKDVGQGIPAIFERPKAGLELRYTQHAIHEIAEVEHITLPRFLPAGYTLVEAEVLLGSVVKWLVRFKWPERPHHDLVMVIRYDGAVPTGWVNRSDDYHQTLQTACYAVTAEASSK